MKYITIFSLFSVSVLLTGCPKQCVDPSYSFSVHAQITPDKDSIRIGDTLYLSSSFSSNLMEQQTQQIINYDNSTGIGSCLMIIKMSETDSIDQDAVFDFDHISFKGTIFNDRSVPRPDGVQQLKYDEIEGKYILRVGLIPKQKGNYVLNLCNGLSNGRRSKKNCEKASFDITLQDTNQHFYLRNKWRPDSPVNTGTYGARQVYYFKVF